MVRMVRKGLLALTVKTDRRGPQVKMGLRGHAGYRAPKDPKDHKVSGVPKAYKGRRVIPARPAHPLTRPRFTPTSTPLSAP